MDKVEVKEKVEIIVIRELEGGTVYREAVKLSNLPRIGEAFISDNKKHRVLDLVYYPDEVRAITEIEKPKTFGDMSKGMVKNQQAHYKTKINPYQV